MTKEFRFGVGLHAAKSLSSVQDAARRAEDLGFDVLHVPDHIGAPAPFPTLMAAAAATTTLRVGTFVLNACVLQTGPVGPRRAVRCATSPAADSSWGWARVTRAGVRGRRAALPERPRSASTTWRT